jgi:hypothetical protein
MQSSIVFQCVHHAHHAHAVRMTFLQTGALPNALGTHWHAQAPLCRRSTRRSSVRVTPNNSLFLNHDQLKVWQQLSWGVTYFQVPTINRSCHNMPWAAHPQHTTHHATQYAIICTVSVCPHHTLRWYSTMPSFGTGKAHRQPLPGPLPSRTGWPPGNTNNLV